MTDDTRPILVFGATGQQGGAVARALRKAGRPVRAFAKHIDPAARAALGDARFVQGDLSDTVALRAALADVQGVYCALPASAEDHGVKDEDEVRWGFAIADLAAESGVEHFIYSSSNGVSGAPTGIGHYDGKARIEDHVRGLPITTTIVRPAGFMETLMMPGSGLDQGRFSFFVRRDQYVQLIAVDDIGRYVAAIFADPARFAGQTVELASDTVTGDDIEAQLSEAAGRPIAYSRYSGEMLKAVPLLGEMQPLLDRGPLQGHADFALLHDLVPDPTTFRAWLAGSGRAAFRNALEGKAS